MPAISAANEWRAAHPGAIIGVLEISGLKSAGAPSRLRERKLELEASLRRRYQGSPGRSSSPFP